MLPVGRVAQSLRALVNVVPEKRVLHLPEDPTVLEILGEDLLAPTLARGGHDGASQRESGSFFARSIARKTRPESVLMSR